MIQAGNNFRLTLKTLTADRGGGEMRRKNLDGNGAVYARIPRDRTSPIPPAPNAATIS
jgi:hypothetical protein